MDRAKMLPAQPLQVVELSSADIAAALFAHCMSEHSGDIEPRTPESTRRARKRAAAITREAMDKIAAERP